MDTKREDRLCQICHSSKDVEDEQHFVFSAQLTVMLDKSMPIFSSRPFLCQTFSLTLNQMHVVVFSENAIHVGNLLHLPDISFSAFICIVLCLLAPCWSPGR